MTDFLVCIVCLSSDIKIRSVSNTQFLEIYEILTHTVLSNDVRIPKTMCYICYTQLQNCCQFMNMAKRARRMLVQLLSDGRKITKETIPIIERGSTKNFATTVLTPTNYVPSSNNFIEETAKCHNDEGYLETDAKATEIIIEDYKRDEQMIIDEELITIKEEPVNVKLELTTEEESSSEQELKKVKKVTEPKAAVTHQADDSEISVPNNNLLKPKRKYTKTKNKKGRSNKKTHACNTCDMIFSCRAHLTRHLRVHTGERPFSCKNCDKTFAQNSHLVQHMRLHTGEKPYTCHICKNKAFNHRYNYKTHMRKHFGVPSHTCELCDSAFHQKADLKRHIMSHTGEKPYTCTTCNVKFSQNCHLTTHNMRLHNIQKPYSCTICGLSFTVKNDYNNHLITHPENCMFSCSVEGYSKLFNKKSTLTNHIQSHKEERPHSCDKCDKTFKQKCNLVKHIRTVHDETVTQHGLQSNQTDLQINPPTYSNTFTNEPLLNQGVLQLQDSEQRNHYLLQEHAEEYIIP